MKNLKSIILQATILLLLTLSASVFTNSISAMQPDSNLHENKDRVSPHHYTPFTYSFAKERVSYSYEWSGYKRVSDNLNTGKLGGSIKSNRSEEFDVQISGETGGIRVLTGTKIKSDIGYTLNVGANKRVYMGCRVRYKVERGQRVQYQYYGEQKKVISRHNYTVKVPQYGEYALINY